jgi:hypothetical protein
VDAIHVHIQIHIWAMIELQWLTSARNGTLYVICYYAINTTGEFWEYVPISHKTLWIRKHRISLFCETAQEMLKRWLRRVLTEYMFQPAEASAERYERDRKHPQKSKRKRNLKIKPGVRYRTDS